MWRSLTILSTAVMLIGVVVAPSGAIAEGEISNDQRVGSLFVVVDIPGVPFELPIAGCSGSQASETVFLTAGHCLAWMNDPTLVGFPEGTAVTGWAVSLDIEAYDPTTGMPANWATVKWGGVAHWDPGFGQNRANLKDYGVVVFPDGTFPGPYVDLPYEGQLDDMKSAHQLKGLVFDRIGYGVHPEFKQGPPRFWDDGYRYEAQSPYKALNKNWLRLNENNDATGLGGGCYGDSGSPILFGNVAVAVTTGGDPICRSDAYNQRLDTAEAQDFLSDFLSLPAAP